MKLVCPKNNKHNRFIAPAHIAQEWLVDDTGEFIEVVNTLSPAIDKTGVFYCMVCGYEVKKARFV